MQINSPKKEADGSEKPSSHLAGYLVSILLSAAVLVYLGYHFVSSFGSEMTTEFASLIEEKDTVLLDAYVLRNETVLYSYETGGVSCLFADGTKVNVGAEVANIYQGYSNDARSEVMRLDQKLDLLTQSGVSGSIVSSDTSTVDARIRTSYFAIREAAEGNEFGNLPKRRDELMVLLNKRQIITGVSEGYDDQINVLQNRRALYTEQLDTIAETVVTPVSGYFYSALDGYENYFRSDIASTLSLDQFDELLEARPDISITGAVGKIATDFEWQIVTETTRESLRSFTAGNFYNVLFPYNNDRVLRMKLARTVVTPGTDRVLLIFETTLIPEDFSFRRMQPVEVIRSSHKGYRVPISAVRLVDGVQGVYILVGNVVEFRQIDILLEMDSFYIAAQRDPVNDPDYYLKLNLYDVIITGGKNLYAGKMIS